MTLDVSQEDIIMLILGLEELKKIYDEKLTEHPDDTIYKAIYERIAPLLNYLKNERDS